MCHGGVELLVQPIPVQGLPCVLPYDSWDKKMASQLEDEASAVLLLKFLKRRKQDLFLVHGDGLPFI